jgi:anti-sigma factor RsiW
MTTTTTMPCDQIQPALVGYCLSAVEPGEREAIEAHLPGCARCVAELVALKRAIDLAEEAPRPSDAARARLRAAVVAELRPAPSPRRRWERPLAFAFAAVATLFAMNAVRVMTADPARAPAAPAGTSRR